MSYKLNIGLSDDEIIKIFPEFHGAGFQGAHYLQ